MGYSVYEDLTARNEGVIRWAGYGVPAICDMIDCEEDIDRGMGYRCQDKECGHGNAFEDVGCGLHFCGEHLAAPSFEHDLCTPKPDTQEWVDHMLTDDSWQDWRDMNPELAADLENR